MDGVQALSVHPCSVLMPGYSLATRSDAERLDVEADRVACLIRWEIRALTGEDRQRVGRQLLGKHPVEMQKLIAQALRERAK